MKTALAISIGSAVALAGLFIGYHKGKQEGIRQCTVVMREAFTNWIMKSGVTFRDPQAGGDIIGINK